MYPTGQNKGSQLSIQRKGIVAFERVEGQPGQHANYNIQPPRSRKKERVEGSSEEGWRRKPIIRMWVSRLEKAGKAIPGRSITEDRITLQYERWLLDCCESEPAAGGSERQAGRMRESQARVSIRRLRLKKDGRVGDPQVFVHRKTMEVIPQVRFFLPLFQCPVRTAKPASILFVYIIKSARHLYPLPFKGEGVLEL